MAAQRAAFRARLTQVTEGALPRSNGYRSPAIQTAQGSVSRDLPCSPEQQSPRSCCIRNSFCSGSQTYGQLQRNTCGSSPIGMHRPTPLAGDEQAHRPAAPMGAAVSQVRASPVTAAPELSLETCFCSLRNTDMGSSPNFPNNGEKSLVFLHPQTSTLTSRSPSSSCSHSGLCGHQCSIHSVQAPEFPLTAQHRGCCPHQGAGPVDGCSVQHGKVMPSAGLDHSPSTHRSPPASRQGRHRRDRHQLPGWTPVTAASPQLSITKPAPCLAASGTVMAASGGARLPPPSRKHRYEPALIPR